MEQQTKGSSKWAPEPRPSADPALAARVAKLESIVAAVRGWADAAGVAESILQRDGHASKAYERAAAHRDAMRKAMLAAE